MNDSRMHLVGPSSPISGLSGAVDGASLPPGAWQQFTNVRTANANYVEVRGGTAELYAAPSVTNGVFKGGYHHPDLGEWAAIYDPAATKVKIFQNTGGGWTERTDASTRLATNAWVQFGVVQAPQTAPISPYSTTKRYVVAQNGTDTPLVMIESASVFSKHQAIAVGDFSAYRSYATWSEFYFIAPPYVPPLGLAAWGLFFTNFAYDGVTVQTRFVWSASHASYRDNYIILSIDSTVNSGDQAIVEFYSGGLSIDWSTKKQMHILFDASATVEAADIWSRLKVIAVDGSGNTATLYDPTSSTQPRPVVVENGYGKYLAAFNIPSGVASHAYTKLRFDWVGGALSADLTLNLYACLGSAGNVDGGSSFAVSHLDTASFAESPSVVCTAETEVTGSNYGAPTSEGMVIPVVAGIGYAFVVNDPVTTGSATELRMIYMAGVDAQEFYYVTSSGSLSTQTTVTSGVQYPLTAPGGLHQCMPTGPIVKALGSRLLVGGGSLKDVWFSSLSSPLRFRPMLEFIDGAPDYQGAGTIRFQGESVQAIEPMAGTYAGSESVIVWTDQSMQRVDGSDSFQLSKPRRLAPFGTVAPRSVASHNGVVFWLDTEGQVRSFSSTWDAPSLLKVDNILQSIPASRLGECSAAFWKDAYYIAYTPSGGSTNTEVLVWDTRGGIWSKYTAPTGTAAALVSGVFSGARKLCVWTSAGRLLEYDKAGATELGSGIAVTMQTRDLTNDHWDTIILKRVGVVCTTDAGDLTLTRPTRDNTATPTSTSISLVTGTSPRESGGNLIWRYDMDSSGVQGANLKDWGASIEITGTVQPGWRMHSLVVDVSTVEGGADA